MPLRSGETFAGFRIVRLLGSGGACGRLRSESIVIRSGLRSLALSSSTVSCRCGTWNMTRMRSERSRTENGFEKKHHTEFENDPH